MDPMQKWLDELTITHLGCIVAYGPNGRLIFIDVPNKEEEKSSFESDSAESINQNSFTPETNFPDRASAEETNPAGEFPACKESEMKEIVLVHNEEQEKEKKKNQKKGKKVKKNKVATLNDEVPGSDKLQSGFDQRLQILDELVSKMKAPERSNPYTKKTYTEDLNVQLVRRKHSRKMKLHGGCLSPVPEEIPEYAESVGKEEPDTLTSLPKLKKQGVAHQHTEKTKQAVYSENRCVPLVSEKRKPLGGEKTRWSKLKLPSLIGKKKNQQKMKMHEEHVREEARNTTPSIFTRFPLKRNKVKPMGVSSSKLQNLVLPCIVTEVSRGTTRNSVLPGWWIKPTPKKPKEIPRNPRAYSNRDQRISDERLVNVAYLNTRVKELKRIPRCNVHDFATRISSNSRKTAKLPGTLISSLNTTVISPTR